MRKTLLGATLRLIAPGALFCATVFAQQIPQFTILPFAGAPRDIGDNGPATSALLNSPHGVSVDHSGNIYIADTSDNLLRRVAASGIITTVSDQVQFPWHAATGPGGEMYVADAANNRILKISSSGQTGSFAPSAQLSTPRDVTVDSAGNVFILDTGNNRVLKVKPDGSIVLYAGNGSPGYFGDGGPATQALLNFPYGIALDSRGDLFISDSLNQRIRVVTPDGIINTIAGFNMRGFNGATSPQGAALNYPAGLAVDSAGSLYVADSWNHIVRKITQPLSDNAQITTVAGSGLISGFTGDDGPARNAQLSFPYGVAIDLQGNILIADSGNHRIRKIDAQATITTIAGSDHASGDGGPALNARLFQPSGVAIDAGGSVYISDTSNNRVRRVTPDGTISTVVSSLNGPAGLAFNSSGVLYIADTNAHVIRKLLNGSVTTVAGVDGQFGNDGDEGMATDAHLETPNAVAFDRAGNMYIADSGNNRVRMVSRDGRIHQFAGDAQLGLPGSGGDNGPATAAQFSYPRALAIDPNGNVYIADLFNDRVRMVSAASHTVTTVAGTGVRGGAGEGGPATQAQLALPSGLAFDNLGNLYIADALSNRIRLLVNGTLRGVAGGNGAGDTGDGGPALGALIAYPRDIAVDSRGIVYFSDQANNRVRELLPELVTINAIGNAASGAAGGVAPGETVAIYGGQMAPDGVASFVPASAVALATMAANTQVLFDGVPAPLTYLSPGQINAVVPYEVAGSGSTNVVVQTQGRRSAPFTVAVVNAAPGIFANSLGAALNQDGSHNTPSNPAQIGDIITLFATGEGQTDPAGLTGKLATGSPLPTPLLPVTVQIGGQTATLMYAGELPQGAGVMQINAVVPDGITPGDSVPVTLTVGSAQAQSGITLSVH